LIWRAVKRQGELDGLPIIVNVAKVSSATCVVEIHVTEVNIRVAVFNNVRGLRCQKTGPHNGRFLRHRPERSE